MNFDYRVGLIALFVTALCLAIPKSFQLMAGERFCPIAENSTGQTTYYSKNFGLETQ